MGKPRNESRGLFGWLAKPDSQVAVGQCTMPDDMRATAVELALKIFRRDKFTDEMLGELEDEFRGAYGDPWTCTELDDEETWVREFDVGYLYVELLYRGHRIFLFGGSDGTMKSESKSENCFKVSVGLCDMPSEMRTKAMEIALRIFPREKFKRDMLGELQEEFKSCYGGQWTCMELLFEESRLEGFRAGQRYIELLYRRHRVFLFGETEHCSIDKDGETFSEDDFTMSAYSTFASARAAPLPIPRKTTPKSRTTDEVSLKSVMLQLVTTRDADPEIPLWTNVARAMLTVAGTSGDPDSVYLAVTMLRQMSVDAESKLEMGRLGATKIAVKLLTEKADQEEYRTAIEEAWRLLVTVTDEVPEVCERFLADDGLAAIFHCCDRFRTEIEVLANMSMVLSNVAEVERLRSSLVDDRCLWLYWYLLQVYDDCIDIAYNVAGVLANLFDDGSGVWAALSAKQSVLAKTVIQKISAWDADRPLHADYVTLTPMLRLLGRSCCVASQYWAIWSLANLTNRDQQYCAVLHAEDGEPPIKELLRQHGHVTQVSDPTSTRIRKLALLVQRAVAEWKKREGRDAQQVQRDLDSPNGQKTQSYGIRGKYPGSVSSGNDNASGSSSTNSREETRF